MKNIYFKGLDKALDDGCYVKLFNCSLRYPCVRIEKKDAETDEIKLVAYAENGNVISALNSASNKIYDESAGKNEQIWCDYTEIDDVVAWGNTLRFYKLPNGQVKTTIVNPEGKSVLSLSTVADDTQTGFEEINARLEDIRSKHPHDFDSVIYVLTHSTVASVHVDSAPLNKKHH